MSGRLVSLMAVLVALVAAPPGPGAGRVAAAGPPPLAGRAEPPEPLAVLDANGQQVGLVFALGSVFPLVRLRADGRDAALGVFAHRLFPFLAAAYYESSDCSGPPWIVERAPIGAATPVAETAAIGQVDVLLVANGDPESRTFKSRWEQLSNPPACSPTPAPLTTIARPTRVLMDLTRFRPPFRLR